MPDGIMSPFYFAKWDGTNEGEFVQMEYGPQPYNVGPTHNRTVSVKHTLPADPNTNAAGRTRVWDAGAGEGSDTIQANFDKGHIDEYIWIRDNLWLTRFPFIFSPDNGAIRYLCSWESGNSLDFKPAAGSMIRGTISINIRILRTV